MRDGGCTFPALSSRNASSCRAAVLRLRDDGGRDFRRTRTMIGTALRSHRQFGDLFPRNHSRFGMTCVLRMRGSFGPQFQTLALNKKQKRRRVSRSAPLMRTNLTQSYFRPKRARRPAMPVKPKPRRAAAVPLSGVVTPPTQQNTSKCDNAFAPLPGTMRSALPLPP